VRQFAPTLLLVVLAIAMFSPSAIAQGHFVPPHAVYASDVTYPETIVSGMVILSIGLDSAGHINDIEALRDVPSATARSLIAADNWQFAPATLNGKGVDSSITLNILFNPANVASRHVDLNGPDLHAGAPNDQDYVPPHVKTAIFAANPANTLTAGPVALDVRVDKSGRVRNASAIFTTAPLTHDAISAVRRWRFIPGYFRGTPMESNTVVVFVFRPPTTTAPPGSSPTAIH
jgi:Gram-negative bacterial TonB protein C-terminal